MFTTSSLALHSAVGNVDGLLWQFFDSAFGQIRSDLLVSVWGNLTVVSVVVSAVLIHRKGLMEMVARKSTLTARCSQSLNICELETGILHYRSHCISLLLVSIKEVINPVCVLFLSVRLILLQCQATVAECKGNTSVAWFLWIWIWWPEQPLCSICHHYISGPDTKTQPLSLSQPLLPWKLNQ